MLARFSGLDWLALGVLTLRPLSGCGTSADQLLGTRAAAEQDTAAGGEGGSVIGETPANTNEPPEAQPPACSSEASLPLPARRFDFSGLGTELVDRMGGPSGELIGGAALDGSGRLELDGVDDYVDLPNHLLGDESVTVLLWATLVDGPAYWRIFDFGTSRGGEDPDEFTTGTFYVALTTETGFEPSGAALFVAHGGPESQERALTSVFGDSRTLVPLAVVLDGAAATATLYISGSAAAETATSGSLSEIDDVNNWLGRSQYSADPFYPGVYDELRVYEQALSACEVSRLSALGADRLD